MDIALLSLRIVLAVVFLVAGLAKLADLTGSQRALRDFGVPTRLAAPLGLLLLLAELAVAIALLPSAWAWWGAVGALALLLVFVAGISVNLARGRTPDCHCFGQLHSEPIGWSTLVRNGVLAALAAFLVWFGRQSAGPGILDWLAPLTAAERIELLGVLILCALLIGEGWLLFEIMKQQGRLLLRIEAAEARLAEAGLGTRALPAGGSVTGLAVGTPAPLFRLPDLDGGEVTLADLRPSDKALVLLFSDPDCGPCAAIFPEIGRWQRDAASSLAVAVVSRGSVEANRRHADPHGITPVLLQQDREVAQAYHALATPSAVLIDREGKIGSPLAQGAEAIRSLVASAFGGYPLNTLPMAAQRNGNGSRPTLPIALKIGDVAPAFSLPDLAGHLVHLSDFRGSTTLLLFWRPGCGFCQRMLADLKSWEAQPQEGAPRLLVVSTESVHDNQAMGLLSPIVLDQATIRVGSLFGVTGTPMAVLVDAEGRIASDLAAGAPAVLALLWQEHPLTIHG
jgi:peroxiredoxin/uncharacterized membrane protein YphA (DoxX/SURF4 family)